jgi:mannosyltransferase
VKRADLLAAAAMVALIAFSVYLRTQKLDSGYWIDEGLSVGIADRPLGDIPGVLRLDGSPPLYYMLLNVWMELFGRSESATHALSVVFAVLAVPVAWWAARPFGSTAAWVAAVLMATNPFVTQYAQETRMYALVLLLGTVATGAFLRAYPLTGTDAAPARRTRRRWAVVFAVALAAMFYTHNWSLFFAGACGIAWLALVAFARGESRRELLTDGVLGFGGAVLLWLPWVPTFVYQAQHTGAPWSSPPELEQLLNVPERLLGKVAWLALLFAAGKGVWTLLDRSDGRFGPRGRAIAVLLVVAPLTVVAAWTSSQLSPAWASRYFAVAVPPVLLLVGAGLAHAARLGVITAIVIVAVAWAGDAAPTHKSNVRELAEAIGPSLHRGDLVVSTQPEQISVLAYYMPPGLRYATLWGPVKDLGVTDWRDGVRRLRGTTPQRNLAPLVREMPSGSRLVLVEPIIEGIGAWLAPWTELVRVRSSEWSQFLSNEPELTATAVRPTETPPGNHMVMATVLVKD